MGRSRKEVDTNTYTGRFAARLRTLREDAGLSVDQLAEKSGIPRTSLYNWESATRQPLLDQIPVIAKALGVKIADLLPEE